MQYEQGTEKVFMASAPAMLSNDDRELQRTRKILLIVFGIFLGLGVLSLVILIVVASTATPTTTYGVETNYTTPIIQSILSIAFYSFAYYVTHTCRPTGLRVVAWIIIISAVFLGLSIIGILILLIVIMAGVELPSEFRSIAILGGAVLSITIIFSLIILAIEIIIIKLCFKLARLIDGTKKFPHQQV